MCFGTSKQKSVEELIAEISKGMSPAQKAEYWYELSQTIFNLLGKVDIAIAGVTRDEWVETAQKQYPTLTDIKLADSKFYTTTLADLSDILTLDWTNFVPYVENVSDCDDYAMRLYSHLCDYYKINSIVPVWGDTPMGYHAFNLGVIMSGGKLVARLIEPQSDLIFVDENPSGKYIPHRTAEELGIKKG